MSDYTSTVDSSATEMASLYAFPTVPTSMISSMSLSSSPTVMGGGYRSDLFTSTVEPVLPMGYRPDTLLPPQSINPMGIPSGECVGSPTVTPEPASAPSWWQQVPRKVRAALICVLTVLSNLDRILRLTEHAPEWYEKGKELLEKLMDFLDR